MLKGYRTKITGWVMALLPVIALVVTGFDQQAFMQMFNQSFDAILTLYAVGGALVHYFRSQAN
ncbi:MAG TPA: hypothetical protein ENI67_04670 [Gammaproteobacteria bacterium]|nr:hypothetical protein [Gammaproteobacteria bacterium]